MGRSLPSVTLMLQQQAAEIKSLHEALRRSDQRILDAMFDGIQQHRAAIANSASLLPLEAILLLMLLEERKRVDRMYAELQKEIQKLRRLVETLNNPAL